MVLYINACVRGASRTRRLAEYLLKKLGEPVCEVRLSAQAFAAVDEAFLAQRDALVEAGALDDPLFAPARLFAAADTVVIAAPYWDLSFPAALKQYLEQINVVGVTFAYSPEGVPRGLCRAKRLYYITTAGGPILRDAYGYGYVQALAQGYYGIPETHQIKAEGLDIQGADVEAILCRAEDAICALLDGAEAK